MTLTDSEISNARELLIRAIENPFCWSREADTPIQKWFGFLAERLPLMTFREEAYLGFGNMFLPSTDPLDSLRGSVCEDDGWTGPVFPREAGTQNELEINLASRRRELETTDSSLFESCLVSQGDDGTWRVDQMDHSGRPTQPGLKDRYAEITGRLQMLGNLLHAAKNSSERKSIQKTLDGFLAVVGVTLPAHRTSSDPSKPALRKLFAEGRALLEVLWTPLPEEPSEATCEVLAALGAEEQTFRSWALRLSVPVLSWPELQAVEDQHRQAVAWTKQIPRPTARRLAIWMLARRLGSPPERIANKVGAGSDWDFFKEAPNPVDAFAPEPMS